MSARLAVLLGAGGVGKTTLAAGYALALARAGGRVGLLGIDPARRLSGALGLALPDLEVRVPCAGDLRAALLRPEDCLRRWASEACQDPEARARLFANAFFTALADHLAASTDVLAAVRAVEWAERDPGLTDLVIDTAPGLNGVDFLQRPRRLAAFLEGRLVAWLRSIGRVERRGVLRGAAGRVLGGLARIGGKGMLLELGELLSLVEGVIGQMLARLERAQRWFSDSSTEIFLVTSVRDDALAAARQLAGALGAVGLAPRATVVNRALPAALGEELDALDGAALAKEAAAIVRYARAQAAVQRRVCAAVAEIAPAMIVVPATRGLDGGGRIEELTALGERLRHDRCTLREARIALG